MLVPSKIHPCSILIFENLPDHGYNIINFFKDEGEITGEGRQKAGT
jgi:hypothetical protein